MLGPDIPLHRLTWKTGRCPQRCRRTPVRVAGQSSKIEQAAVSRCPCDAFPTSPTNSISNVSADTLGPPYGPAQGRGAVDTYMGSWDLLSPFPFTSSLQHPRNNYAADPQHTGVALHSVTLGPSVAPWSLPGPSDPPDGCAAHTFRQVLAKLVSSRASPTMVRIVLTNFHALEFCDAADGLVSAVAILEPHDSCPSFSSRVPHLRPRVGGMRYRCLDHRRVLG